MANYTALVDVKVNTGRVNQAFKNIESSLSSVSSSTQKTNKFLSQMENTFGKIQKSMLISSQAGRSTVRQLKQLSGAAKDSSLQIDQLQKKVKGLETQLEKLQGKGKKIGNFFVRLNKIYKENAYLLQSMTAAFFSFVQYELVGGLRRMTDQFVLMQNRIRVVNQDLGIFNKNMANTFAIAQETRQPLFTVANTLARIGRNSGTLRKDFTRLARVTSTIGKAFQIAGATIEEANNAMIQLSQAFASGRLQGDELRSVLELAPRLAQGIANSIGITVGQMREFAKEGKLTTKVLEQAIVEASGSVDKEFETIQMTIGQAMTKVNNSIMMAVGSIDNITKTNQKFANAFSRISKAIDKAGKSPGGIFLAEQLNKIADNLETILVVGGSVVATGVLFSIAMGFRAIMMSLGPVSLGLLGLSSIITALSFAFLDFGQNTEFVFTKATGTASERLATLKQDVASATEVIKKKTKELADLTAKIEPDFFKAAAKMFGIGGLSYEVRLRDQDIKPNLGKDTSEREKKLQAEINSLNEKLKETLKEIRDIEEDIAFSKVKQASTANELFLAESANAKDLAKKLESNANALQRVRINQQRQDRKTTLSVAGLDPKIRMTGADRGGIGGVGDKKLVADNAEKVAKLLGDVINKTFKITLDNLPKNKDLVNSAGVLNMQLIDQTIGKAYDKWFQTNYGGDAVKAQLRGAMPGRALPGAASMEIETKAAPILGSMNRQRNEAQESYLQMLVREQNQHALINLELSQRANNYNQIFDEQKKTDENFTTVAELQKQLNDLETGSLITREKINFRIRENIVDLSKMTEPQKLQLDFIDSELRKRQEITRQIRLQRDLLNEKNRTRGMKTANEVYDLSGQGNNKFGGLFGGFFGKRRVSGRDVLKQDDSVAAGYSQGVLKIIKEFGLSIDDVTIGVKRLAGADREVLDIRRDAIASMNVENEVRDKIIEKLDQEVEKGKKTQADLPPLGDQVGGMVESGIEGSGPNSARIKQASDAAAMGAAVAGPLGAVVAGLTSLVMSNEKIQQSIEMFNTGMADAMDEAINPLGELFQDLVAGLKPVFTILGQVMKPLGRVFKMFMKILNPLMGLIEKLQPIFFMLEAVMMGLMTLIDFILQFIGGGIEMLLKGFGLYSGEEGYKTAALLSAEQRILSEIEQTIEATADHLDKINDVVFDIAQSALNLAAPAVKLEDAAVKYDELYAAATAPLADDKAIDEYTKYAKTFLQQSQDMFRSSQAYQNIYDEVMDDLDQINTEYLKGASDTITDVFQDTVFELDIINSDLAEVLQNIVNDFNDNVLDLGDIQKFLAIKQQQIQKDLDLYDYQDANIPVKNIGDMRKLFDYRMKQFNQSQGTAFSSVNYRNPEEGGPRLRGYETELAASVGLASSGIYERVLAASLLIMNPEHYAVAVKRNQDGSLSVIDRGTDATALAMLSAASAAGVPVVVDPPTARALYAGDMSSASQLSFEGASATYSTLSGNSTGLNIGTPERTTFTPQEEESFIDKIKGGLVDLGGSLAGFAEAILNGFIDALKALGAGISQILDAVFGFIGDAFAGVSNVAQQVLGAILGPIVNALGNVGDVASQFLGALFGVFDKIIVGVPQFLTGLFYPILSMGAVAVDTFLSAVLYPITTALEKGFGGAMDVFQSMIVDPILSALGIDNLSMDQFVGIFEQAISGLFDTIFGMLDIEEIFNGIWETITDIFNFENIWGSVTQVFQGVWDVVVSIFDFNNIWGGIQNLFQGVWNIVTSIFDFENIFGGVQQLFSNLWDQLTPIFDFYADVFGTVTEIFTQVWDQILGIFGFSVDDFTGGIQKVFSDVWDNLTKLFTVNLGDYAGGIQKVFQSAWDAIVSIFEFDLTGFSEGIQGIFEGVWDSITGLFGIDLSFDEFLGGIQRVFDDVWDNITKLFEVNLTDYLGGLQDVFRSAWDAIVSLFSLDFQGFADGIQGVVEGIWDSIMDLFGLDLSLDQFLGGIQKIFSDVWDSINDIFDFENIFGGIQQVFQGVWDSITGIFNFENIFGGIQDLFTKQWELITGIFDFSADVFGSITDVFKTAWDEITKLFNLDTDAFLGGIQDVFSGVWDSITSLFSFDSEGFVDGITKAFEGPWNAIMGLFGIDLTIGDFADGIQGLFSDAWDTISDLFGFDSDLFGSISGLFDDAWDSITDVFSLDSIDVSLGDFDFGETIKGMFDFGDLDPSKVVTDLFSFGEFDPLQIVKDLFSFDLGGDLGDFNPLQKIKDLFNFGTFDPLKIVKDLFSFDLGGELGDFDPLSVIKDLFNFGTFDPLKIVKDLFSFDLGGELGDFNPLKKVQDLFNFDLGGDLGEFDPLQKVKDLFNFGTFNPLQVVKDLFSTTGISFNLGEMLKKAVGDLLSLGSGGGDEIKLLPNPFHSMNIGPSHFIKFTFAKGGHTGGLAVGPSHEQGGIPGIVGGTTPIEFEGGEFIMSKKTVDAFGVDKMHEINNAGRGVAKYKLGETVDKETAKKLAGVPTTDTPTFFNVAPEIGGTIGDALSELKLPRGFKFNVGPLGATGGLIYADGGYLFYNGGKTIADARAKLMGKATKFKAEGTNWAVDPTNQNFRFFDDEDEVRIEVPVPPVGDTTSSRSTQRGDIATGLSLPDFVNWYKWGSTKGPGYPDSKLSIPAYEQWEEKTYGYSDFGYQRGTFTRSQMHNRFTGNNVVPNIAYPPMSMADGGIIDTRSNFDNYIDYTTVPKNSLFLPAMGFTERWGHAASLNPSSYQEAYVRQNARTPVRLVDVQEKGKPVFGGSTRLNPWMDIWRLGSNPKDYGNRFKTFYHRGDEGINFFGTNTPIPKHMNRAGTYDGNEWAHPAAHQAAQDNFTVAHGDLRNKSAKSLASYLAMSFGLGTGEYDIGEQDYNLLKGRNLPYIPGIWEDEYGARLYGNLGQMMHDPYVVFSYLFDLYRQGYNSFRNPASGGYNNNALVGGDDWRGDTDVQWNWFDRRADGRFPQHVSQYYDYTRGISHPWIDGAVNFLSKEESALRPLWEMVQKGVDAGASQTALIDMISSTYERQILGGFFEPSGQAGSGSNETMARNLAKTPATSKDDLMLLDFDESVSGLLSLPAKAVDTIVTVFKKVPVLGPVLQFIGQVINYVWKKVTETVTSIVDPRLMAKLGFRLDPPGVIMDASVSYGTGGLITGKDHRNGGVDVKAEGGEYILNKEAVRRIGVGNLHAMNYGNGGLVFEDGGSFNPLQSGSGTSSTGSIVNENIALFTPTLFDTFNNIGTDSLTNAFEDLEFYELGFQDVGNALIDELQRLQQALAQGNLILGEAVSSMSDRLKIAIDQMSSDLSVVIEQMSEDLSFVIETMMTVLSTRLLEIKAEIQKIAPEFIESFEEMITLFSDRITESIVAASIEKTFVEYFDGGNVKDDFVEALRDVFTFKDDALKIAIAGVETSAEGGGYLKVRAEEMGDHFAERQVSDVFRDKEWQRDLAKEIGVQIGFLLAGTTLGTAIAAFFGVTGLGAAVITAVTTALLPYIVREFQLADFEPAARELEKALGVIGSSATYAHIINQFVEGLKLLGQAIVGGDIGKTFQSVFEQLRDGDFGRFLTEFWQSVLSISTEKVLANMQNNWEALRDGDIGKFFTEFWQALTSISINGIRENMQGNWEALRDGFLGQLLTNVWQAVLGIQIKLPEPGPEELKLLVNVIVQGILYFAFGFWGWLALNAMTYAMQEWGYAGSPLESAVNTAVESLKMLARDLAVNLIEKPIRAAYTFFKGFLEAMAPYAEVQSADMIDEKLKEFWNNVFRPILSAPFVFMIQFFKLFEKQFVADMDGDGIISSEELKQYTLKILAAVGLVIAAVAFPIPALIASLAIGGMSYISENEEQVKEDLRKALLAIGDLIADILSIPFIIIGGIFEGLKDMAGVKTDIGFDVDILGAEASVGDFDSNGGLRLWFLPGLLRGDFEKAKTSGIWTEPPEVHGGGKPPTTPNKNIAKLQAGGYLMGPSHENGGIAAVVGGHTPIEMEGGEYVISKKIVDALGVRFFDAINFSNPEKYDGGRFVQKADVKEAPEKGFDVGVSLNDLGSVGQAVAGVIGNHGIDLDGKMRDMFSGGPDGNFKIFRNGGEIHKYRKDGFVVEGTDNNLVRTMRQTLIPTIGFDNFLARGSFGIDAFANPLKLIPGLDIELEFQEQITDTIGGVLNSIGSYIGGRLGIEDGGFIPSYAYGGQTPQTDPEVANLLSELIQTVKDKEMGVNIYNETGQNMQVGSGEGAAFDESAYRESRSLA